MNSSKRKLNTILTLNSIQKNLSLRAPQSGTSDRRVPKFTYMQKTRKKNRLSDPFLKFPRHSYTAMQQSKIKNME